MVNLDKEIASVCQLLHSWEMENLELAFQLMKGNAKLNKQVRELHLPVLDFCNCNWSIKDLLKAVDFIKTLNNFKKTLAFSEVLVDFFRNMPVYTLNYSEQKIKEFPWWICQLQQLRELNLEGNKIESIPKEIVNLQSLYVLDLSNNKLKEIPAELCQLIELEKLKLSGNKIAILPDDIGNLLQLKLLFLDNNPITFLPKTAHNLSKLTWLNIEGTPLGKKNKISKGAYIKVDSPEFIKLLD